MKHIPLLVAAAALAGAAWYPPASFGRPVWGTAFVQRDDAWEEVARAYREGRYDLAIELADKILAQNPRHGPALNTKGAALFTLKRYPEALAAFDRALEIVTADAVIWCNRARAHYQLKHYSESIADFSRALELNPANADAWIERGFAWFDSGRLDQALADYDKAIALNPKHAGYRANRARLLRYLARLDEAVREADEAVRLDPKNALAVRESMRALLDAGRLDEAGAMLDRLAKLEPNDAQTQYDRGRWHESAGRLDEALRAYDEALRMSPGYPSALRRRADLLRRMGRLEEAQRDERAYESNTGRGFTAFPPAVGMLPVPTGGPRFEGWPKENAAPAGDVPWRKDEPALKADELPEDVSGLDLDAYQAMAREALEMVRLVYGDMTQDESDRLQAKWAPILDFPTLEAYAYFGRLNPLLNRYLQLRGAVAMSAAEFDQSWERATLAAGLELPEGARDALRQAQAIQQSLTALRDELARVVAKIRELGDPPNPYRARKRAYDAFTRAMESKGLAPAPSGLAGLWEGSWSDATKAQFTAPFMLGLIDAPEGMRGAVGSLIAVSVYGPYANYYRGFMHRMLAPTQTGPGTFAFRPSDRLYLGDLVKSMRLEGDQLIMTTQTEEPPQTLVYRLRRLHEPYGPGPAGCTLVDAIAARRRAKELENMPGDDNDPRVGIDQHRQAMELNGRAFMIEGYHETRLVLPLALKGFVPSKPHLLLEELEKRVEAKRGEATVAYQAAKAKADAEAGVLPTPPEEPRNETRINEIRSQIALTKQRLEAWKAELATEKDPKRAEQLRLNVIATITDLQDQEALAQSLRTGELVRPRTLWQQLAQARLVEQMQMEARQPILFARAEKQLDGLIEMVEGPQRAELERMKAALLTPEARVKGDTEALRRLFSASHNLVLGQQGAKEAYNEQMINSLEEVKFGAGLALIVVAPYAATSASPYAGYAGWIGAGYGVGTGYVEGGVVGAAESGLRMVSGTADVALTAIKQYDATGSWTEAGKAAALQAVLRVGLQLSSKMLVQQRLRGQQSWNEAVLKTRFKELKEEGRVLTQEYKQAAQAFEQMVAKRPHGGDVAAYVRANAAELAKTPEGVRLVNAMGSVENSYSTKLVMNESGDKALMTNYNRNLGAFVEQPVIASTRALMKRLGYSDFTMKPIRHGANTAKKGMDNDLAVDENGWTPMRDGKPVTLLEFQRDLTKCLSEAYRGVTGRSAHAADWRGTTRVDPEAYLDRAVLGINAMREQGLSPAQILRALNPQMADQTVGVNVYKVQRALGRPGVEGIAEACRTLTKELDTKVLPTLPKGGFEHTLFLRLRNVLAQGGTDPVGTADKVRLVTGRDLNQVARMLADRFGLAIKGGG